MNNCLVTKLPGEVTDTSLLKVGDMKFHIVLNEGEYSSFVFQFQKNNQYYREYFTCKS